MDLSIPSKNALLVISIHMFYNILHIIFPFSPERSLTGMYIRKIVLADDEGTQLKILSSLIHKLTPQTELVLCSDGYAAWEAVQAGDAELLITDIRMPSMDGIELIRQVSEAYPMTAIVLISAWQEFDYAQSAIACGVSEYLVKPFRVEDIRKLLSKMETKISSMQKEQERSLGYEALLEQHLRESRQSLLLSLMYGRPCGETTFESPLLHSLSASLSSPGVMAVLRWEVRPGSSSASSPFALSRPRMETLTEYIHRLFHTDFLVPLDNSLSSSERRLALLLPGFSLAGCISSFERLISLCRAEDIVFQAGLSKEHPDLFAALNTALCQAEEALSFSFYFPGKTTLFDCHKPDSAPAMFSLSGFEKNIRRAVHTGNCEEIQRSLSLLEKELSQEPFKAPARVKHGVSSLAVSVIKDLDGMIPQKEYDSVLDDAYYLYSGCNSLTELFAISLRLLERAAAYFTQESGQYDTAEDVIAYLKKHFTEDLSLQQLADKVHFSASYLSAQILKKTGMAYSSYLGYLRTEKARQLLLETDLKIMDIAAACGYKDNGYFNRIFRRKYGSSPEQYRKAHKKC